MNTFLNDIGMKILKTAARLIGRPVANRRGLVYSISDTRFIAKYPCLGGPRKVYLSIESTGEETGFYPLSGSLEDFKNAKSLLNSAGSTAKDSSRTTECRPLFLRHDSIILSKDYDGLIAALRYQIGFNGFKGFLDFALSTVAVIGVADQQAKSTMENLKDNRQLSASEMAAQAYRFDHGDRSAVQQEEILPYLDRLIQNNIITYRKEPAPTDKVYKYAKVSVYPDARDQKFIAQYIGEAKAAH